MPSVTPSPLALFSTCLETSFITPDALGGLMESSLAEEKATDVLVPNQVSSSSLLGALVCHLDLTPATESADSSQLSPCSQQLSLAEESCLVQGRSSFQWLVDEVGALSWPTCL